MSTPAALPLLDQLLEVWKPQTGADHLAYRNHCHRLVHFCLALHPGDAETERKYIIAATFHDLGIWESGTIDYLPPSVALAQRYLAQNGLQAWSEEISAMIDEHHRLRACRDAVSPLVEVFRRADLVDVSLGLLRSGIPRAQVKAIRQAYPNAGFHKRLGQLAGGWFKRHPLSPPPFLKW